MADDPEGAAAHNWGLSSQPSNKCAMKHFDILLKRQVATEPEKVARLLFGKRKPSEENIAYQKLSLCKKAAIKPFLMNRFAHYLANTAVNQQDMQSSLSYECASRYLSSV